VHENTPSMNTIGGLRIVTQMGALRGCRGRRSRAGGVPETGCGDPPCRQARCALSGRGSLTLLAVDAGSQSRFSVAPDINKAANGKLRPCASARRHCRGQIMASIRSSSLSTMTGSNGTSAKPLSRATVETIQKQLNNRISVFWRGPAWPPAPGSGTVSFARTAPAMRRSAPCCLVFPTATAQLVGTRVRHFRSIDKDFSLRSATETPQPPPQLLAPVPRHRA